LAADDHAIMAFEKPLLRLPAVGDNAAMPSELPKADPPKTKRRWFQFSLRSLLVGVTLLAVASWVIADRARLIHERDESLHQAKSLKEANREYEADQRETALKLDELRKSDRKKIKGLEEQLRDFQHKTTD
jgi:septal ring factor EnvC (AmiA/AmiB activator)